MAEVLVDSVRYHVEETVKGGMGQVWLLSRIDGDTDPVYLPKLAVKTFDSTEDSRVVVELNHWISLKQDNILPLLRIGRLNFQTAALMPWRMGSLDTLLRKGVIDAESVTVIVTQVLAAIEYCAEKHSLTHLDIKPANVLVRSTEPLRVEVADWGISRLSSTNQKAWFMPSFDTHRRVTRYGAGTLPYMAPERLTTKWQIAVTADIYSVGMMTLEMLTGELPFSNEDDLVDDIFLGRYFERAKKMLEGFPPKLSTFCEACLNPVASRRPQSVIRAMALL